MAKLSYVLSKADGDNEVAKSLMQTNLRGEISDASNSEHHDVMNGVVCILQKSTAKDEKQDVDCLYSSIIIKAVVDGDIALISELSGKGANLSACNCDGRTPLHFAALVNNPEMIRCLLITGVDPNVQDLKGLTPLDEAIKNGNLPITQMLVKCGSQVSKIQLGERLCEVAGDNAKLNTLKAFQIAGVDLSIEDSSGRTGENYDFLIDNNVTVKLFLILALHLAALHNNEETLNFLLDHNNKVKNDAMGMSPLDYAMKAGNPKIINRLKKQNIEAE